MDEQKVRAYLTKLAEDKAFQDRMQAAKTPEDALAEAKKNGFDFDADEFRELMIRLTISVKQAKGEELSDEELAMVAGGVSNDATAGAAFAAAGATTTAASACV